MSFNNRFLCGALAFAALSTAATRPAQAIVSNIALGKPATTSGVGFGGVPSNGVDGNINTITHSANTGVNFWQVDLTAPSDLISIELVNRADGCCPERLNGAVLSVLDSAMTPIFTAPAFSGAGVAQVFTFDNAGSGFSDAQFIRVDHNGNWLAIAELRAFSDVAYGNLATFFGTATQSTLGFGLPASNAIDGSRVGNSISHTNTGDMTPNLTVDLGNLYRIETIDVYTRDNCCTDPPNNSPERDYNLTVEVLDAGGNVVYTHPVFNPWDGVDPAAGAPVVGLGASFSIDLGAGIIGQSVRVNKVARGDANVSEWLSLAEVEIYGSTTAVPEPSSVCLAALGLVGGLLVVRRRRRR
ncbi:MAG: PEP-CTERM sorting domain-containing protein [Pirellulales bacterium]